MTIELIKFGEVLTSHSSGKEAYLAFLPILSAATKNENVVVDFAGVSVFSPSWGDEFLTPLQTTYGERLTLKNTANPSVALTISTLEKINKAKFKIT
jgi:hypothetical protein